MGAMISRSLNSTLNTWHSHAAPPLSEPQKASGHKGLKPALNYRQPHPERCCGILYRNHENNIFRPTKRNFIIQNMLSSASCCVALPLGPRVEPRVTSLISKPQTWCVSDQLSGSPAVPNLPREPLTPPVVNRMDMVFVVLVEGKALLLMTLRSPGLRAHDGSHRLCWLNCKYSSVHKHRRVIIMGAGLGFYVKYWCTRDSFGAEWHYFDVRAKLMVLLWC